MGNEGSLESWLFGPVEGLRPVIHPCLWLAGRLQRIQPFKPSMPFSPHSRCARQYSTAAHIVRPGLAVMTAIFVATSTTNAQIIPAAPAANVPDEFFGEPRDLLKEELSEHWTHFSSVDQTPLGNVWKRVPAGDQETTELVCSGDPRGYLYTNQQYTEFDMTFEWRYLSDPNGNSGVLVFTQNDRRLWPTSIQVQLHQPKAGSVFPSGKAVTENIVKQEGLAKPVGEWNKCQIVSRSGRVLVHINGQKSGEVTGCNPASGRIALQSEGSIVHFRRMMIRGRDASEEKEVSSVQPDDAAAKSLD